ncbi:MAG TPA: sulfatase-like hydrolase/transferase [Vicinamibacteria bacterium]|nr:sulfatase-like hydrolase/transferase [Vicinamibacteria bacterium]
MRALVCAASGASLSVTLWLTDLVGLSDHAFAGVSDEQAAASVLAVTEKAVFALELKLLATHVLVGALCGSLVYPLVANASRSRQSLCSGAFTLAVAVLALFGMMGTYPQLFADRFWLSGGPWAGMQWIATHTVGPRIVDALLLLLLAAAILNASRTLIIRKRFLVPLAAGSLFAFVGGPLHRSNGDRTNVLILATDSLRSDRIEDLSVMPFTATLLDQGTLFRHAVTPIARTYPAWVSALTGTEPRANGVRHMFPTLENRRDVGPTLFTELRDRGYFTFAASDFAGDIFPGFQGGFELTDTPHLTVDTLAQSTVLTEHTWSLPLLRLRVGRRWFPYWRNVPSLADPDWVAEDVLDHIAGAGGRAFAGLVFFSTAHFPYVAPFPDYRRHSENYRGRYLYHVPPYQPEKEPDDDDIRQIRARYDAALTAVDGAMERLLDRVGPETLVIITGDHGEDLYEEPGIAGHGDTIRSLRSQSVPIFLMGPNVPRKTRTSRQVRLYDLPATVLALIDPARGTGFGHGVSLFENDVPRPVCVETGIWFWPGRPLGLQGKRLDYPGISELLELEPQTRELVLRDEIEGLVESAKERGLVLGDRLHREQLTPKGIEKETLNLPGVDPTDRETDLVQAFEQRCVEGDDNLHRRYGAIVFERNAR